jgi:hypothetical protein
MRFRWPTDIQFRRVQLDVEQEHCLTCRQPLQICAHRRHRLFTLQGPLELCCRLARCSSPLCPARHHFLTPKAELSFTLPRWFVGWDVFCWMGYRRFAHHWSVPQLHAELLDSYQITLSEDAIEVYLRRYQTMVAARQQDLSQLRDAYRHIDSLVLSIDGLQPEKGHEALYAVRELRGQRIWFAEALLSSTVTEVKRLLVRARRIAQRLGKPVRLWISDKQDAFVKGIASVFAGVPHRYCSNHFLRDLAKPLLEQDSHAKVQMRRKVRGLRAIERSILERRRDSVAEVVINTDVAATDHEAEPAEDHIGEDAVEATPTRPARPSKGAKMAAPKARCIAGQRANDAELADVVLTYCAVVRGILNDDQGGPLTPPGLRMAAGLKEVRESLGRNLALHKPGPAHGQLERLAGCIDSGLSAVEAMQQQVQEQVAEIRRVAETLDDGSEKLPKRRAQYNKLRREYDRHDGDFYSHLSQVMESFAPGLFVWVRGKKGEKLPVDNLDLERWFRKPKGHERRIHGHKHTGMRLVQTGATLLLVLDAHENRSGPFTAEDLLPYRDAELPADEREVLQRRKVMRKARSQKNGRFSLQS